MNTPEVNIKDSLSNSHQGAVLSAMGALGANFKNLFSESAQQLSTTVSRLGVVAAVLAIATVAGLATPGQAHAQWGNASPWATQSGVNDAFQQQRQTDFANQAARVVAEQRNLSSKDVNLASLAALGAGAFTKGDKAPIAAAVVGVGAAMLIPNGQNSQNGQNFLGGGNNGGSMWQNASPWGSNNGGGGYSNNGGYGQQQVNAQTQAVQQAFARYQQLAEPQFQIAVQANLDGQLAVRDAAIVKFGNHWNAASQMGIPLSTSPDQVAKYQMLGRMNPQALQYGLQTRIAEQPQITGGYPR